MENDNRLVKAIGICSMLANIFFFLMFLKMPMMTYFAFALWVASLIMLVIRNWKKSKALVVFFILLIILILGLLIYSLIRK